MTTFRCSTIGAEYANICQQVLLRGDDVSPRGQHTKEILDALIIADSPYDTLPTGCGRGLNPTIGVAEALQLIGGVTHPELMTTLSSNFSAFLDDGKFAGAYGPRLQGTEQVLRVIQKIKTDRDTRQAVMTLWNPALDNTTGKHDYPCTISLIFTVRKNRLNLHVTMRSNDVWWGLCYDAFQFTQLQISVARALRIEPGEYRHHAVSLHAYERDWEKIDGLTSRTDFHEAAGVGRHSDAWYGIQRRARSLLAGRPVVDPTATEEWMAGQLQPALDKLAWGES